MIYAILMFVTLAVANCFIDNYVYLRLAAEEKQEGEARSLPTVKGDTHPC
jgi:hypothetical protein